MTYHSSEECERELSDWQTIFDNSVTMPSSATASGWIDALRMAIQCGGTCVEELLRESLAMKQRASRDWYYVSARITALQWIKGDWSSEPLEWEIEFDWGSSAVLKKEHGSASSG